MRYKKRLLGEHQDLSAKLVHKGLDGYNRNRLSAVQVSLDVMGAARTIDLGSEQWRPGIDEEWIEYLGNLQQWLRTMPKMPVAKKEAKK